MNNAQRTAEQDVLAYLEEGERAEAVVFGEWGWGNHGAPTPPPVPVENQGSVMTWDQARPLMQSWSFEGGYGSPDCYAVRIWTNKRVLWVTQYDGSTRLGSAPRNPVGHIPNMPGG